MVKNLVVVGLEDPDKVMASLEEEVEDSALHDPHDSSSGTWSRNVANCGRPRSDIGRRCADKVATRLSVVVVGLYLLVAETRRRRGQ